MKISIKTAIGLFVSLTMFASCKDEEQTILNADFSASKVEVTAGEKVMFKDQSTGNPARWNWVFEGGTPAISQLFSPEIIYEKPGVYTVILTVGRSDDSSMVERKQYITVDYPKQMTADFTADKTVAMNDEMIQFTDLTTGYPSAWKWTFMSDKGTVVTSAEQNPLLKFEPGLYTVKLEASNPKASNSIEKTDFLNVIDKNAVSANFTADHRMIVEGNSVKFTDISLGRATQWNWTFEGGSPATSSAQSPTVTFKNAGRYKVQLTASNEVNSSTATQEGYIVVLPAKDLVAFYPFDGDGKDVGPNGIHSQILKKGDNINVNFNAPSRKEGTNSAEFQSVSNDRYAILSLPDNSLLNFQAKPVTTAFWVKTSNKTASKMGVFQQGSGPNASPDGKNKQTWFRFQKGSPYLRYVVEYSKKSGNWTDYKAHPMTDGQWHHYVCVHSNGSTYLYIDGVKVSEALNKGLKEIDAKPYYIGAMYRGAETNRLFENFLDGCIDDYVIYSRALSAAEIRALYDSMK